MANTIVTKDLLMKEVIKKLDLQTVIAGVANTKYEGELRRQGDTVSVQNFPNVDFTYGGTAGDDITATDWAITSEDLTVSEVFQLNQKVEDINEIQSNLDLISKLADRISKAQAWVYDRYVADLAVLGANSSNVLFPGAPKTLNNTAGDADNVVTRVSSLGTALKKNNVDVSGAYLFINPAVEALLYNSNLVTGFDKGLSYREKGAVGMVAGMMTYRTNDLPVRYLLTMTGVAVADETIVFTITDNKGTDHTITFTAKAVPSAAGQFDIAGSTAAQVTIMKDMINGTGTPGATSYIALSAADRNLMNAANVYATASGTDKLYITMSANATLDTLSAGITNGTVSSKGVVLIAMDNESVHFVKQEDGFKITDGEKGFYSNVLVENVYGGKVFTENGKRIATLDVTNE